MKKLIARITILLALLAPLAGNAAGALSDGRYRFTYGYAEHIGRAMDATCIVVIKGRKIRIVHDGNKKMKGRKGDILDQGILIKHKRTGKWIVGKSPKDAMAGEIGGCTDGPNVIDLKKRIYWTC